MASPKQLLRSLDKMLSEDRLEVGPRDLASDPDYVKDYTQTRSKVNKELAHRNVLSVAGIICEMLEARPAPLPSAFRLCSIGCGSGLFDREILEEVLLKFPETKFHYVGLDINDISCQQARKCVGTLSGVMAETHADDIQQLNVAAFEPFDMVTCMHTLYYAQVSLEDALRNCIKLTKPGGKLVILNAGQSPISDLYSLFYLHQNKNAILLTPSIKQTLNKMGISYTESRNEATLDFTQCLRDNFQHPYQKHILSFIMGVNAEEYPQAVWQVVMDYLRSVAQGGPEEALVPNFHDMLVINAISESFD